MTRNPKKVNRRLRDVVEGEISLQGSQIVDEDPTSSSKEATCGDDSDATDSGTDALQPLRMYFEPTQYKKKIKVSTRCFIMEAVETLLQNLKHPLKPEEKSWFVNHPQFKHFFHMHKDENHKVMGMWMLLLRTACTDKRKEAWFVLNGVPIRYGISEHALISGLSCRNYPLNYTQMSNMDFVSKHFGRGAKITYAYVKEKLNGMRASQDRLKMAVLYFLSSIIKGQTKTGKGAPAVEPFFQRAVDDLHLCKTFLWGRFSFDHNMREILHTMDHFKGVVYGNQWTFPSFCTPLELLAFEAIPTLKEKFREDIPGAASTCPRMCKTKFKRSVMKSFTLDEVNEGLGKTKVIESILVPSHGEETLMARIIENEDVDDVDDPIVRSWMKRLIDEEKVICFKEMYMQDVAIREEEEPENEMNEGEEAIGGLANGPSSGLVELIESLKENMEKGFHKINDKFDGLDRRVVVVETYVKEQLDARRSVENMDYTFNENYAYSEGGRANEKGSKDKGGGGNDGETGEEDPIENDRWSITHNSFTHMRHWINRPVICQRPLLHQIIDGA